MPGIVVTGGTGELGRAVVGVLLRDGARVAVPYRSRGAFEALQAACGSGAALWGRSADLTVLEEVSTFMNEASAWAGGITGVAALAGAYAGSGRLEDAPAGEWPAMMRSNLDATYAVCRAALPHLLRQGGAVVTVASRLAEAGGAGAVAYAVSKAGVIALTRALALENEDRGVRFNCVSPWIIDTPSNRAAMPEADTSGWTPPEKIASVILFLLSSASAAVTGALVPVDGKGPSKAKA